MNDNIEYNQKYFDSNIFDFDYLPIAEAIINNYSPRSVFEFGCGKGELSKLLSERNIKVEAIDGFSLPGFSNPNFKFHQIDLNSPNDVEQFLKTLDIKYDVAVCLEVAEHLTPEVSQSLIKWLTSVSNVVIFSAAVPNQGGVGHINCRTREFWNDEFLKHKFQLLDLLRSQLRNNKNVATWYKLNILDYAKYSSQSIDYVEIIKRLIASESHAASEYYNASAIEKKNKEIDDLWIMKSAFNLHNRLKTFLGKKPIIRP